MKERPQRCCQSLVPKMNASPIFYEKNKYSSFSEIEREVKIDIALISHITMCLLYRFTSPFIRANITLFYEAIMVFWPLKLSPTNVMISVTTLVSGEYHGPLSAELAAVSRGLWERVHINTLKDDGFDCLRRSPGLGIARPGPALNRFIETSLDRSLTTSDRMPSSVMLRLTDSQANWESNSSYGRSFGLIFTAYR